MCLRLAVRRALPQAPRHAVGRAATWRRPTTRPLPRVGALIPRVVCRRAARRRLSAAQHSSVLRMMPSSPCLTHRFQHDDAAGVGNLAASTDWQRSARRMTCTTDRVQGARHATPRACEARRLDGPVSREDAYGAGSGRRGARSVNVRAAIASKEDSDGNGPGPARVPRASRGDGCTIRCATHGARHRVTRARRAARATTAMILLGL